jgi:hypothetical protein
LRLGDDGLDGLVDAALEAIGLAPAVTFLRPSLEDGLGEDGGGGGAVAGDVGGLGGDFLDHLGAHVLEGSGSRFPWRRSRRPW